ncbi:immune inhibitor A domain-containing protein, partial [Streptomyces sp. JAC25]
HPEVSDNGGTSWAALDGPAEGKAIPRDASDKPALPDVSGAVKKLSYPLNASAGKKIDLPFRYQTDGGAGGKGFTADAIT